MPTKTPVRVPASASGGMAGVLERLPGDLEQQPLLRIHVRRLARRDAEERGVEAVDVVEEPAPAGVHLARHAGGSGRKAVGVPAVRGHLADRVDAVAQQLPEGLGPSRAGKAAADADDGDRRVGADIARRARCGRSVRGRRRVMDGRIAGCRTDAWPARRSSGSRRERWREIAPSQAPARRPARPRRASRGRSRRTAAGRRPRRVQRPVEPRSVMPATDNLIPARTRPGSATVSAADSAVGIAVARRVRRVGSGGRRGAFEPLDDSGRRHGTPAGGDHLATRSARRQRNAARQAWRWILPLVVLGRSCPLDEHDGVDFEVVLLRRSPGGSPRAPRRPRRGGSGDRLRRRRPVAPRRTSTEKAAPRRPAARRCWLRPSARCPAGRCCGRDDDQVLEPAGDEQLAAVEEPEVAGAQERRRRPSASRALEGRRARVRRMPVALRDARPATQISPTRPGGQSSRDLRVDDQQLLVAPGRARSPPARRASRSRAAA